MESDWYYISKGQQAGPVSPQKLKELANLGHIQPNDFVWKDGMADWFPASKVKGLFRNHPSSELPPPLQTPVPPPVQRSAIKPESIPEFVSRNKSKVRKNLAVPSLLLPVLTTTIGIAAGCVVGYFAAHHFAFFGGFALIGQPYSPARSSLVPGHMLLCGLLLGTIGLGLGILFVRLSK
jgi:hypothetical protein